MKTKDIIAYKARELEEQVKGTISDGMRELYCMLLFAEKGDEARRQMIEDEYCLAAGALEEVKK